MVMERMPACRREGTGGCQELGRRAPVALGGASERARPGRSRGAPQGGPGARPPPSARARRGQPGRREPPAGGTGHAQTAARSRRERASAPPARATYLGALRPRMLQVRAGATPAGRGRARGYRGLGARSAPPRPHPSPSARRPRGRAGGRRGPGVPTPRRGGEGAPGPRREGASRAGWGSVPGGRSGRGGGGAWACAPTRAGVDVAGDPGGPSAAATLAPGAEGAHGPRGASQARRPDLGSQGESASRLSKMAFPGPGTNSSANKSSPFRGRYRMIYQVPAVRQLQWGSVCENAQPPGNSHFQQPKLAEKLRLP